jgi:hypothetical protein
VKLIEKLVFSIFGKCILKKDKKKEAVPKVIGAASKNLI